MGIIVDMQRWRQGKLIVALRQQIVVLQNEIAALCVLRPNSVVPLEKGMELRFLRKALFAIEAGRACADHEAELR